ncbi:hypothetical protein M3Y95_00353500 [Aphelenchoides besseyi]|nr:hypothetical protein M3Y95_00353500 [Aphelenchoides besseyi]
MANDTATPQLHCALKYHFFIGLIFLCLYVAIVAILMVIYSTVYRRNLRWLCPKKKGGKDQKKTVEDKKSKDKSKDKSNVKSNVKNNNEKTDEKKDEKKEEKKEEPKVEEKPKDGDQVPPPKV